MKSRNISALISNDKYLHHELVFYCCFYFQVQDGNTLIGDLKGIAFQQFLLHVIQVSYLELSIPWNCAFLQLSFQSTSSNPGISATCLGWGFHIPWNCFSLRLSCQSVGSNPGQVKTHEMSWSGLDPTLTTPDLTQLSRGTANSWYKLK